MPKPEDRQLETRQRLMEAAGEVFAEQGFRAATVREICRRANANVAAVNYHFGDKAKLYAAVLRYSHACATQHIPSGPAGDPHAAPELRLRSFVHAMLRGFLAEGRPAWHAKLMTREMAEPSGLLDDMVEHGVRPRYALIRLILRDLLVREGYVEPTDDDLRLCAFSVVGQCMFYRFGQPVITRLHPPLAYDEATVAQIADHVASFSLGAVKQLARERRSVAPEAAR